MLNTSVLFLGALRFFFFYGIELRRGGAVICQRNTLCLVGKSGFELMYPGSEVEK